MSSENLKPMFAKMFLQKTCTFLEVHVQNILETDPGLATKLSELKSYIEQFINDNFAE